jgi:hypothetical protein
VATQTADPVFFFFLFRINVDKPIAVFQCLEQADCVWTSPAGAPFGGIQCADNSLEHELLFFLDCILTWITAQGGKKLTVRTAPSCHSPDLHHLLSHCYNNTGFYTKWACINTFISVCEPVFKDSIQPTERRRLKRAKNAGFTVSISNEISSELVYGFLKQCRTFRGYSISLNFAQIKTLRESFPDRFQVFAVRDGLRIIALTLTVRINRKILYNFLSDYLPEYHTFSPTVMLMECVYMHCQQEKIKILDLGISVDAHGDFKPSLHRFKQNIGGQDCEKVTYEIQFPGYIPRQFPSL